MIRGHRASKVYCNERTFLRQYFMYDQKGKHEPEGKLVVFLFIGLIILGTIFVDSFGPLGQLPGDVHVSTDNAEVFVPLATMVFISLILLVIFNVFNK